jgi:Leucine-rich repeat (LRR) protein
MLGILEFRDTTNLILDYLEISELRDVSQVSRLLYYIAVNKLGKKLLEQLQAINFYDPSFDNFTNKDLHQWLQFIPILQQKQITSWKQLDNSQKLILPNYSLTKIPAVLSRLKNLQKLKLPNNLLTDVPLKLGQLTNLQCLNLNDNELVKLPAELGQLKHLELLYVNENKLIKIPKELGQLKNLRGLYLNDNQLTTIPKELGLLSSLQELEFYRNKLIELPKELGQLTKLQKLRLDNNQLTEIPAELGQLTKLQRLLLDNNQLVKLPNSLGQLTNLEELSLQRNRLEGVPTELQQLRNLQTLDLRQNQNTKIFHHPLAFFSYIWNYQDVRHNTKTYLTPSIIAQTDILLTLIELYVDEEFRASLPLNSTTSRGCKIKVYIDDRPSAVIKFVGRSDLKTVYHLLPEYDGLLVIKGESIMIEFDDTVVTEQGLSSSTGAIRVLLTGPLYS